MPLIRRGRQNFSRDEARVVSFEEYGFYARIKRGGYTDASLAPSTISPSCLRTTNSATSRHYCYHYAANDDGALHLHSRICMHKHDNPRVCSCRIFDVDRIVDAAIATFFIPFPCTHLKKKGSIFFSFLKILLKAA